MKIVTTVIVIAAILALGWYFLMRTDVSTTPTPSPSVSSTVTPSASASASVSPSASPTGSRTPTPSASPTKTPTPTPTSHADIRVTTPTRNAKVTSPLSITGEARGSWYFEAVFPVKLLDANGKVIAQGQAHATGDWMTTNFVPFTASLTFSKPSTATGTLVLENDNPSGLPQNAKAIAIPVKF